MPPSSPSSNQPFVVAIDGPAGAGKSTAARLLARTLDYVLLDTGAIYRTVALRAREQGISFDDGPAAGALAEGLPITFAMRDGQPRTLCGDRDVSEAIRTPEISQGASRVSAHPEVRAALLGLQRAIGANARVVAEGRDVGTVVFPDARAKFFLTASHQERARRRTEELRAKGVAVDPAATLAEIEERDRRDSTRSVAPLVQAADAVLILSDGRSPEDIVTQMASLVRARGG